MLSMCFSKENSDAITYYDSVQNCVLIYQDLFLQTIYDKERNARVFLETKLLKIGTKVMSTVSLEMNSYLRVMHL